MKRSEFSVHFWQLVGAEASLPKLKVAGYLLNR